MAGSTKARDALIEDIEFLLSCAVGEAAILEATGYTRNPVSLKRCLQRAKRHDLIRRIFEWDAAVEEQQRPNKKAAA